MRVQIRELRERTGMSQSQFAAHFDIPLSTFRKWEQAEAEPAKYLIRLLARQIPAPSEKLKTIKCKDGTVFYYDDIASTISDAKGNTIIINEDLSDIKEPNLPIYVQEMFSDFYDIQKKFKSDCMYDRKEDFIWG